MKAILLLFIFINISLTAQNSFRPNFSIGINSGFLEGYSSNLQNVLSYENSMAVPVSVGFEYKRDTFLLFVALRHSKEKAIFQTATTYPGGPDIMFFTKSLSLQVCPGLHVSERSKIFLVSALSFPYAAEAGSSSSVDGTNYNVQVQNTTDQSLCLNLGLSLYIKPFKKTPVGITFGAETSSLTNKTRIRFVNTGNQPVTHDIYYSQFFFFAMVRIN